MSYHKNFQSMPDSFHRRGVENSDEGEYPRLSHIFRPGEFPTVYQPNLHSIPYTSLGDTPFHHHGTVHEQRHLDGTLYSDPQYEDLVRPTSNEHSSTIATFQCPAHYIPDGRTSHSISYDLPYPTVNGNEWRNTQMRHLQSELNADYLQAGGPSISHRFEHTSKRPMLELLEGGDLGTESGLNTESVPPLSPANQKRVERWVEETDSLSTHRPVSTLVSAVWNGHGTQTDQGLLTEDGISNVPVLDEPLAAAAEIPDNEPSTKDSLLETSKTLKLGKRANADYYPSQHHIEEFAVLSKDDPDELSRLESMGLNSLEDGLPGPNNSIRRPPPTITEILKAAILGSPQQKLTIAEIRYAVAARFLYFAVRNERDGGWKLTLKHFLTNRVEFCLEPRLGPCGYRARGGWWTFDPTRLSQSPKLESRPKPQWHCKKMTPICNQTAKSKEKKRPSRKGKISLRNKAPMTATVTTPVDQDDIKFMFYNHPSSEERSKEQPGLWSHGLPSLDDPETALQKVDSNLKPREAAQIPGALPNDLRAPIDHHSPLKLEPYPSVGYAKSAWAAGLDRPVLGSGAPFDFISRTDTVTFARPTPTPGALAKTPKYYAPPQDQLLNISRATTTSDMCSEVPERDKGKGKAREMSEDSQSYGKYQGLGNY